MTPLTTIGAYARRLQDDGLLDAGRALGLLCATEAYDGDDFLCAWHQRILDAMAFAHCLFGKTAWTCGAPGFQLILPDGADIDDWIEKQAEEAVYGANRVWSSYDHGYTYSPRYWERPRTFARFYLKSMAADKAGDLRAAYAGPGADDLRAAIRKGKLEAAHQLGVSPGVYPGGCDRAILSMIPAAAEVNPSSMAAAAKRYVTGTLRISTDKDGKEIHV